MLLYFLEENIWKKIAIFLEWQWLLESWESSAQDNTRAQVSVLSHTQQKSQISLGFQPNRRLRIQWFLSSWNKHIKMAKKKGFMTPERKKKLRTLLRKKAAEELKKEQERKAEERLRVIAERCGTKADLENGSTDELKKICQQYFDKWYSLEGEMFFLQREVILRDLQINELTISVSDMKGKFIKPTLKKVSKYENKFAKLQEKAAKFAFANQLKAK